jgi:glycosyltransferase involved in cell wall biosynthesis
MNNKIMKLSIVIPAFNEGSTIHEILDKINAVELLNGLQKEIIVINDFSTDNTSESIKNYIKNNARLDILYL